MAQRWQILLWSHSPAAEAALGSRAWKCSHWPAVPILQARFYGLPGRAESQLWGAPAPNAPCSHRAGLSGTLRLDETWVFLLHNLINRLFFSGRLPHLFCNKKYFPCWQRTCHGILGSPVILWRNIWLNTVSNVCITSNPTALAFNDWHLCYRGKTSELATWFTLTS